MHESAYYDILSKPTVSTKQTVAPEDRRLVCEILNLFDFLSVFANTAEIYFWIVEIFTPKAVPPDTDSSASSP